MKKYRKIAYLVLIVIIIVLSMALYVNISKGSEEKEEERKTSEINFLEEKLVNLFNEMNNIQTRNYSISVSEISEQSKKQKDSSSNNSKQEQDSQKDSNSSSGSDSSTSSDTSSGTNQKSQKFELEAKGVLTNSDEINWDYIKSEIEILYSSLPTITLDLYKSNVNQENVLNFNKEFDNLTIVTKNEKKEETLNSLSKLYEYLIGFIENSENYKTKKDILESKLYILKAYAKLDSKNWVEIGNNTKQSIDIYSRLLSNTNLDANKQYSISKVYVMINELQNAVEVQDESVFLIKYKNILEEMNSLV